MTSIDHSTNCIIHLTIPSKKNFHIKTSIDFHRALSQISYPVAASNWPTKLDLKTWGPAVCGLIQTRPRAWNALQRSVEAAPPRTRSQSAEPNQMFSETETGSRMNSIWPRTSVGRGASSELSLCVINGKRFAGCIPPFCGGRGERVKLSAFSTC